MMLADASEAAVRAINPASVEEIRQIVQGLVVDRLTSGELDDCNLTMAELREIRNAFVQMLQGVFHPRIKYPEGIQGKLLAVLPQPAAGPPTSPDTPCSPSTSLLASRQDETCC